MGLITIQTAGSFQSQTKTFRADHHGHAEAVAQAIGRTLRWHCPANFLLLVGNRIQDPLKLRRSSRKPA